MANKEIKITFEIDGIKKEVSSVKELQTELNKTATATQKATKANDDLSKSAKDTNKQTGFLKKQFDGIKETFGALKADAKGVAQGFVKFSKGLGLSAKASKGLAVGLSALGIPLLLAGIAALVDYFKNFEGAAKLVETALNVVGAVVRQLTDAFIALINFDFSGVADAIGGIGDAASEAASQTNELYASAKRLHDIQKENVITNAQLRQEIEKQKKILEDSTLTLDERLDALAKVNQSTEKLQQNEIAETEAVLANLKAQLALTNNYEERRELEQSIADTMADLIDKETALNTVRQDAAKVERELIKQVEDERQAAAQAALERRKAFNEQLTSLEQKNELDAIKDLEKRAERRLQIERDNAIKDIENSEFTTKEKRRLIEEVNESYDLQEQARVEQQNEKIRELERQAGEKLIAVENEIALMRADSDRERAALQLQQQEERELQDAEKLENNEALKEAIREKYRLKREEAEMTTREKINEILGVDTEEEDMFAKAERQLALEQETALKELDLLGATETQKEQIRNKFAKKKKKLDKDKADFEIKMQEQVTAQNLQAASALFGNIASLVGEGSAIGKAAAVAQTTIDTYQSATAAYKSVVGIPFVGPALAPVAAGVAVAGGLMNVKKILSTKTPGKQTGGGGGVPAPSIPTAPSFNPQSALDAATEGQQLDNEVTAQQSGSQSSVVKAFVVSSDMTEQQDKDKKINDLARL